MGSASRCRREVASLAGSVPRHAGSPAHVVEKSCKVDTIGGGGFCERRETGAWCVSGYCLGQKGFMAGSCFNSRGADLLSASMDSLVPS